MVGKLESQLRMDKKPKSKIKVTEEVGGLTIPVDPDDLPEDSALRDFIENPDLTDEEIEEVRRN